MPLKKCTKDGKSGWKYGDEGTCYTGKNAKKKAIKQGIAIEGPKKFAEKAGEHISAIDLVDISREHGHSVLRDVMSGIATYIINTECKKNE